MWGAAPIVATGFVKTREGGRCAVNHESGDLPGRIGMNSLPWKGQRLLWA